MRNSLGSKEVVDVDSKAFSPHSGAILKQTSLTSYQYSNVKSFNLEFNFFMSVIKRDFNAFLIPFLDLFARYFLHRRSPPRLLPRKNIKVNVSFFFLCICIYIYIFPR